VVVRCRGVSPSGRRCGILMTWMLGSLRGRRGVFAFPRGLALEVCRRLRPPARTSGTGRRPARSRQEAPRWQSSACIPACPTGLSYAAPTLSLGLQFSRWPRRFAAAARASCSMVAAATTYLPWSRQSDRCRRAAPCRPPQGPSRRRQATRPVGRDHPARMRRSRNARALPSKPDHELLMDGLGQPRAAHAGP
jgi:hypothetical protein